MSHDISKMVYVGKEPWHGLGTALPANADYDAIIQAAGFYTAVERPVFSPPMVEAIPDRKALFREDTGEYLSTVSKGYEVVQFAEVARTLVEAAVTSRGAPREFEVPEGTPPLVREEREGEHRVRPSVTPGRSPSGIAYREQPAGESPQKIVRAPIPPGLEGERGAYRWTCDKGTPVPPFRGCSRKLHRATD